MLQVYKKGVNVEELATIIDDILSSKSSYGSFYYGLKMVINLGFLPNNSLMKRQLTTPLLSKLELVEKGEFEDYTQIYDHTIMQLKYYLYNIYPLPHDGNRIPSLQERWKQLDFMLDFSLVTALSEYPLTKLEPKKRIWDSTAAIYLIALPYLVRNMVGVWRTANNRWHENLKLFNSLDFLEKELSGSRRRGLRSISEFSELVTMAEKYIDEKLPHLRERIVEGTEILKKVRRDKVAKMVEKLMYKADKIYDVMQMNEILPAIYKEYLTKNATIDSHLSPRPIESKQ